MEPMSDILKVKVMVKYDQRGYEFVGGRLSDVTDDLKEQIK